MSNTTDNTSNQTAEPPAKQVLMSLSKDHDGFEEQRRLFLKEALGIVPFDGWTPLMMQRATKGAGLSSSTTDLAFPSGIVDLLDFWAQENDRAMLEAMTKQDFQSLKIREKVTQAVQARLHTLSPHHEAARRAAATLALPLYAGKGAKFIWRSSDLIWRGLGDTSTDFNYYSKRATLSAVWTSTFTHWLADESEHYSSTKKFLDDRIENVMGIEKLKANMRKQNFNPATFVTQSLMPILAKARYRN